MKKRIISLFLIVCILIPFVAVPSSAVAALPSGVQSSAVGVVTNASYASGVATLISDAIQALRPSQEDIVSKTMDILASIIGYGQMPYWKLQKKVDFLNTIAADEQTYGRLIYQEGINRGYWLPEDSNIEVIDVVAYICSYLMDVTQWKISTNTSGQYIIVNSNETFVFADSLGRYPYADDMEDLWIAASDVLSGTVVTTVGSRGLQSRLVAAPIFAGESSYIGKKTLGNNNSYNFIIKESGGQEFIWCNYEGIPYGTPLDDTQAGGGREYNNDTPDQPLVNGDVTVDIDPEFIYQMFPDGSFTWIDNITFDASYDASNKVYNIDASSTYNTENNYYYSYEWNYTYYIDYTSITYIGQTAEYNEEYEYYYNLPDGRSSADLTLDELQALNTQIDVLPYIRSADDTSIRALYHFDGDTLDSSYWSHIGHFDWQEGASITYMDAGVFNGALYLDENEHQYSITLPSNISTGNFTMQFRLYISSTLTPVYDSYFSIDGGFKLGINGEAIVVDSGQIAPLSNGAWQDICAMRKDGVLYLFLNGVPVKTWSDYSYVLDDTIQFVWGDEQQTFKYFDEFRFVNKAIYETDGYVPSSVPFDTNLALVLPDSQLPVADEYWSFESSGENLLSQYGTDLWVDIGSNAYITNKQPFPGRGTQTLAFNNSSQGWYVNSNSGSSTSTANLASWGASASNSNYLLAFPYFNYWWTSLASGSTGIVFTNKFLPNLSTAQSYPTVPATAYNNYHVQGAPNRRGWVPYGGLLSVLGYSSSGLINNVTMYGGLSSSTDYTFSLVFSDGTVKSVSFNLSQLSVNASSPSYVLTEYDNTVFGVSCSSYASNQYATYWLFVAPKDVSNGASTDPIVYMELVEGSSTDLTAEFVSSVVVMDKDDLNTPSLAVRTDVDITSYQIGGVRPSLPEKGMVWAMVENSRITSLQVYNGQAWEEVDGRIWTGSRWVPYYAYDVVLLKDLYDVVGTDPTMNPIYSETGFWTWLQNAWKDMIARLDKLISVSGGGGTVIPDSSVNFPGEAPDPDTGNDGWQFIDLIVVLKDGTWSIVTGVVNGVFGGFQSMADHIGNIGGFFQFYSGEDFNVDLGVST